MADNTPIEWADATVNAINGCSLASPGCTNCYAMKQAHRFPVRQGLTAKTKGGMMWTGEVRLSEKALLQPLAWKRPRTIFWNAHGDTFHDNVPDEWIDRLFAVMALTPQHKHLVLTKRSARMRAYVDRLTVMCDGEDGILPLVQPVAEQFGLDYRVMPEAWPLPNAWLGVSVEDQKRADERIPDLLATPAAGRFLSCEPLLGPVDLSGFVPPPLPGLARYDWVEPLTGRGLILDDDDNLLAVEDVAKIDGVIVGGESGPRARPMHPDWARTLRDQCAAADVDFHFKQWGSWVPLRGHGDGYWPTSQGGCIRLTVDGRRGDDGQPMQRVGKKAAGRSLDGVTHDALPWRRAA